MFVSSRRALGCFLLLGWAVIARSELVVDTPLVSRTLPNGFEVLVYPDRAVPLVTVEFAVRMGSQFETTADNGLAHLNEHMFWRTNRAMEQKAEYLQEIGQKGINYNGTTREEVSESYVTARKEDLPVALRFMRDAALAPSYRADELAQESEVVVGELDRIEANRNSVLSRRSMELLFPANPVPKNPIGSRANVRAATPGQMLAMHDRFFVPENCALVVTGDCDPEAVFQQVTALYGDWSHGTQSLVVPDLGPPLARSVAEIVSAPDAGTTIVQFTWRGPSVATDTGATYAADTLCHILNRPGSRFQKALMDSGLVLGVSAGYYTQRNVGPVIILMNCDPGRARAAVKALCAEVQQLAAPDYFTDEELADAKTALAAADLFDREKPTEYAHTLAFWWATAGTPYLLGQQQAIRGTTRTDIVRYVQRYLLGRPYVALTLGPASQGAPTAEDLLTP